jgi:hypothetical protein
MWKLLTTLTSIAYLFTYVRLCTENGIIKGMFGREQLIPCPDHDAKSIGINYKALDKSKVITMTEAGEMYYAFVLLQMSVWLQQIQSL